MSTADLLHNEILEKSMKSLKSVFQVDEDVHMECIAVEEATDAEVSAFLPCFEQHIRISKPNFMQV